MKSSRDHILAAIAQQKPAPVPLPVTEFPSQPEGNLLEKFTKVALGIGSKVYPVQGFDEIGPILGKEFPDAKRVVSHIDELHALAKGNGLLPESAPHAYENVDLALLAGDLAVAENSAVWLPEKKLLHRVLPFICQHLALLISRKNLVANMQQAYEKIESSNGGYGVFIAGPSKTADIEQSLVLGAHGPRSLSIFVLEE